MAYTDASIFYSHVCLTFYRNAYIDICMYVYKLRAPQYPHHAKHSYVRLSVPCTHVYVLCYNTLHKVPIPTMHTYANMPTICIALHLTEVIASTQVSVQICSCTTLVQNNQYPQHMMLLLCMICYDPIPNTAGITLTAVVVSFSCL